MLQNATTLFLRWFQAITSFHCLLRISIKFCVFFLLSMDKKMATVFNTRFSSTFTWTPARKGPLFWDRKWNRVNLAQEGRRVNDSRNSGPEPAGAAAAKAEKRIILSMAGKWRRGKDRGHDRSGRMVRRKSDPGETAG